MVELTIFACPKGFVGRAGEIQRNAIRSWVRLGPDVEVILLGDDEGVAEAAQELGMCPILSAVQSIDFCV